MLLGKSERGSHQVPAAARGAGQNRPDWQFLLKGAFRFARQRGSLYNSAPVWDQHQNGRCTVVAVAQLVESRIVIPVVVGSSPISHPKEYAVNTKGYERRLVTLFIFLEDGVPNFGR
jgi:hypothetical protein